MGTEKSKAEEKVTIEAIPRGKSQIGGKIEMSEEVVATIAALAARQVNGVHTLGRSHFISFGKKLTRGVGAEVGAEEAALDIEVVLSYGVTSARSPPSCASASPPRWTRWQAARWSRSTSTSWVSTCRKRRR